MNRIYLAGYVGLIAAAIGLAGCDSGGDTGGSDMDAMVAQMEQNKKAASDAAAAEQAKAEAARVAAEKQAAEEAARQQSALKPAAVPPEGGTATAGASTIGQEGGYLSAIAGAHRYATSQLDNLAWKQQLQSYRGETGTMPKDTAEFLKIMQEKEIPLPELEQGQEYFWDPNEDDLGTLYIVDPAPEQPAAPPAE